MTHLGIQSLILKMTFYHTLKICGTSILIKLAEYDVVAFTTYISNIRTTDYIARYLKQKNPKIQIWYGALILGIAESV